MPRKKQPKLEETKPIKTKRVKTPPPPTSEPPTQSQGEGGGVSILPENPVSPSTNPPYLKPSELALLAREAGRFPMSRVERREAVQVCLDVMRKSPSNRTKLGAVKTFATLDRLNMVDEGKGMMDRDGKPSLQVNVVGEATVNALDGMDLNALLNLQQQLTNAPTPAEGSPPSGDQQANS